ncbi:hypothetical protein CA607_03900 [Caulobacter vibrioides]|nr:hypothetical protein CA607_03900 [Caulobacter vibrioides]
MVQLPRERFTPYRTCGGQMGPAHKARDDGDCYVRPHPLQTFRPLYRGFQPSAMTAIWRSMAADISAAGRSPPAAAAMR